MTDTTSPQTPPGDRLFALIASIPGSGTVDWCGPARALLDEIAAPSAAVSPPPAADRAALLREAADRIEVLTNEAYERALSEDEIGYANGLENAMKELRRLAAGERDEQQAQQGCPDPIECDHEAALGLAEMRLGQVRAKATEWSALAPPDDWGNTPQDTVLADTGRYLLRLIDETPAASTPVAASTPRANENDGTVAETADACTCGSAGDAFVPSGHYADCPCPEARQQHGPAAAPVAGQPPADAGEEAQPRFVRVCIACPECDHTLDENGACANGCHVPPAVVAEPGKEK